MAIERTHHRCTLPTAASPGRRCLDIRPTVAVCVLSPLCRLPRLTLPLNSDLVSEAVGRNLRENGDWLLEAVADPQKNRHRLDQDAPPPGRLPTRSAAPSIPGLALHPDTGGAGGPAPRCSSPKDLCEVCAVSPEASRSSARRRQLASSAWLSHTLSTHLYRLSGDGVRATMRAALSGAPGRPARPTLRRRHRRRGLPALAVATEWPRSAVARITGVPDQTATAGVATAARRPSATQPDDLGVGGASAAPAGSGCGPGLKLWVASRLKAHPGWEHRTCSLHLPAG